MKTLYESILDDEDDILDDQSIIISNWLEENCYIDGTYKILKNNSVVVKGNVSIRRGVEHIDVKFKSVTGKFEIYGISTIKSFENIPPKAGEISIMGDFKIKNLKGCPKKINGDFSCRFSNIKSLEGGPEEVTGKCYLHHNLYLKTLIGGPKIVGGDYDCSMNPKLTSLEGAPEKFNNGNFYCNKCKHLKSLEGAPEKVNKFICKDNSDLESLNYLPKSIKYLDISRCGKCKDIGDADLVNIPTIVCGFRHPLYKQIKLINKNLM